MRKYTLVASLSNEVYSTEVIYVLKDYSGKENFQYCVSEFMLDFYTHKSRHRMVSTTLYTYFNKARNKDDVELLISRISEEDIFCLDYWKTFFINSKDTLPGTTITFSFMSLCLSLCSLVLAISNITIPGQPKEESQLLAIGFVVFVLSMIILVATVNVRDKRLEKYTASIYLLTKAIEKNQNKSVRP